MTDLMERSRVTFDIPEPIRRAILIYAAEKNLSVGAVVEWMSQQLIPDQITQAERSIAEGPPQQPKRGRPPRKP